MVRYAERRVNVPDDQVVVRCRHYMAMHCEQPAMPPLGNDADGRSGIIPMKCTIVIAGNQHEFAMRGQLSQRGFDGRPLLRPGSRGMHDVSDEDYG